MAHEQERLGDDLQLARAREQIERDADRAVEGVLDRHDRPFDLAGAQLHDGVVDRLQRHRLDGAGSGAGQQRLLAEGALGPQVADPWNACRGHSGEALGDVAGPRGEREGQAHGLGLLW